MSPTYRHRVRYFEADQQGVVFNMWYLGYFDEAMAAFLDSRGLPYPALLAAGFDVQLVHTEIDWTGPLRWGDEAAIDVSVVERGRSSFALRFDVSAAGPRLAVGRTVYVVVRSDGSGKVAIPPELDRALGPPEPSGP